MLVNGWALSECDLNFLECHFRVSPEFRHDGFLARSFRSSQLCGSSDDGRRPHARAIPPNSPAAQETSLKHRLLSSIVPNSNFKIPAAFASFIHSFRIHSSFISSLHNRCRFPVFRFFRLLLFVRKSRRSCQPFCKNLVSG